MSDLSVWRVIVDRPARGTWNMAVDEALLDAVSRRRAQPTLRLYRWTPACLSLGYFQSFAAVDVGACRSYGVTVVRRPTGGRAILHDRELTYSIALPVAALDGESGVLQSYYRLSQGLMEGLRGLGVETTLAPSLPLRDAHGPACFDRPSDHEILLNGRKLIGSAQVRRNGALLQHGSVLFRPQVEEVLRCLRLDPLEADRQRTAMADAVAGLDQAGSFTPGEVGRALAAGLAAVFGVQLQPGSLSPGERDEAAQLERRKYRTPAWTERGEDETRTR